MNALVLGGTGFVGMNVVRALQAAGHEVAATRRVHTNTLFARRLGVPLLTAELDDTAALERAMHGRDVVFMCAAHYPRYSLRRSLETGTARARMRHVLSAACKAGVERLVLTSSLATVGTPRAGAKYADELDPVSSRAAACVYHAVKLAIEEEALSAARARLDVVILCPGAIFGELDVKAGTGHLLVALANGRLPFYVDGQVNVVDVDDLARAHVLAAERGRTGERYIIGGHNLSVRALLEQLALALDVPLRARRVPASVAAILSSAAELWSRWARSGRRPFLSRELVDMARFGTWVASEKATDALELPPPTPLEVTLRKAVSWYVRHRYVKGALHANHTRTDRA